MNARLPAALAHCFTAPSSETHRVVADPGVQADLNILRRIQSGTADRVQFDRAERQQAKHQHQIGRTL